jgi:hypothetical protein
MARSKTSVQKFRSDIATLKRKGLISGVDARSVKPTKHLKSLVNKYEAVISGKATAVKLSHAETRSRSKAGDMVARPRGLPARVIVPHDATERVVVSHGHAKIVNPSGIERVQIPIAFDNLEDYLQSIARKHQTLNRMKANNEYFAFQFYGHRSHSMYTSIDLMIEDLLHYEAVENAIDFNNAKQMNEVYHHLEIVKLPKSKAKVWEQSGKERAARTARPVDDKKKYRRAKAKRDKGPQWQRDQFNAANAARQKAYRERLTQKEKKEYRAAAVKRAKKSAKNAQKIRAKQKPKKK